MLSLLVVGIIGRRLEWLGLGLGLSSNILLIELVTDSLLWASLGIVLKF